MISVIILYMRLNYQIFRLMSETSELRGMKNFAIQIRVHYYRGTAYLVLQRRVLELGTTVFPTMFLFFFI